MLYTLTKIGMGTPAIRVYIIEIISTDSDTIVLILFMSDVSLSDFSLPAKALELAMREVVKKRKPGSREINAGLSMPASLKLDFEAKVRSL